MAALNSLVRVHQWELDEKRQKLGDLERLIDKLRNDLVAIDRAYESEKTFAGSSPELTAAFASYAAVVKQRRHKVLNSISALEQSIEAVREEVRSAFQELKKYQTAQSNQQRREQAKRVKREQQELDEMGLNLYRRRRPTRRAS